MKILLPQNVLLVHRDLRYCANESSCWCAGCCDGCAQELVVSAPSGEIMGYVKQTYAIHKFDLYLMFTMASDLAMLDGVRLKIFSYLLYRFCKENFLTLGKFI
jgi:hypothetical protein